MVMLFAVASYAQGTPVEKFFESYQDNEEFTMVYVSPKMFKMLAKVAGDELDSELSNLVKDLKGLKVLTTEKNTDAIYKEALSRIPTSEYELLMSAREEGQNIKIMTKSKSDDVIEELLLIVGGVDDFALVSFIGNINLSDLAKVASSLDIEGAKHLEKLGQE